ncbi:hypothetical protein [Streptomyces sp. NPDC059564]
MAPDRDRDRAQHTPQQQACHGAGLLEGDPLPADGLTAAAAAHQD